jgi:hypothetical protein
MKESFTCELPGMADDGGVYHYSGRLGVWLSAQRNFRKFHPEKLKPEREAMLQQLVNEGINVLGITLGYSLNSCGVFRETKMGCIFTKN